MFRRVYLDNAATTPLDPAVVEAMMPYLTEHFGNPSSIHYFGQQARAAVDKARHQVADLIGARPNEIIFTSGGTEADNLAIRGFAESNASYGRHIIASAIEHPAVRGACEELGKRGFEITYLPVYENGIVKVDDLKNAIRPDTLMVSVMTANNEIGTLQAVVEIGRVVRERRDAGQKIWFHTDAVQAAGKTALNVGEIGCDLLTISAHKIHGPKGSGALYLRRGVRITPQNLGGHQERERRGGTESVALIAGFGEACEIAGAVLDDSARSLAALRDELERRIANSIPNTIFNGDRSARLPNITNISFRGIEGEALLINLDMHGIAVSTGSACSSGTLEPSPVIRALGREDGEARSAVRFSLGRFNTIEDIDRLMEVLPSAVENLRGLAVQR
ncbi:MAG: cysteine desulfurase [Chloracidobacterium sp.]|nr:cysteine desulfurase [Chloracidobacterium sp.]